MAHSSRSLAAFASRHSRTPVLCVIVFLLLACAPCMRAYAQCQTWLSDTPQPTYYENTAATTWTNPPIALGTQPLLVFAGVTQRFFQNGAFVITQSKVWAWNGADFYELGAANGRINALAIFQGKLVIGGTFTSVGTLIDLRRIAQFDGLAWQTFSDLSFPSNTFSVNALLALQTPTPILYIAGSFEFAGTLGSVRTWNGFAGNSVITFNGAVNALAVDTGTGVLYAGGAFTSPFSHVAANFPGGGWNSAGADPGIIVNALCMYNGKLYAGGKPASFSNKVLSRLVSGVWTPLVTLGSPNDQVNSLQVYSGDLFAGGTLTSAAPNLWRFNEVSGFRSFGGVSGPVLALGTLRSELVALGEFSQQYIPTTQSTSIARWVDSSVPWIGAQPATPSHPVCGGLTLSVGVAPGYNVSYQWRKSGAPIQNSPPNFGLYSGANTPTLTIGSFVGPPSYTGNYDCVITNFCGSVTTNQVAVQFVYPTQLQSGPRPVTVACTQGMIEMGVSAAFDFSSATATWETFNNGQWVALPTRAPSDPCGWIQQGSVCRILPPWPGATGCENYFEEGRQFRCVISSLYCSSVTSSVTTLHLSSVAPSITAAPTDTSACPTGQATFHVDVLPGDAPETLQYLWSEDVAGTWTPVFLSLGGGGTITNTLTVSRAMAAPDAPPGSLAFMNGRRFRCEIRDGCWTVNTDPVTLHVCDGDLNCDSMVDDSDFVLFASAYDTLDCFDPAMASGCPADANGDRVVDDVDFVLFATGYDALICP